MSELRRLDRDATVRLRPLAVVFDVGGVLVHPDGVAIAAAITTATGHYVDAARCAPSLRYVSCVAYRRHAVEEDPEVLAEWAAFLALPAAAARAAWDAWRRVDGTLWTVVDPAAFPALDSLASLGVRRAVVSNADGTLEESLRRKGLLEHFELVLDSGRVGITKPDPRIFLMAADALGCAPADCWYVGDTPAEVQAALDCQYGHAVLVGDVALEGFHVVPGIAQVGDAVAAARVREAADRAG
jgi:putative hydrolase of the HAD superfamily